MSQHLSEQTIAVIQNELLDWYRENCRDLPWRKDKDPYKIWVSEIMLQQTRVDTVIPYFERFIDQFPTIESLAEASDERVVKAWEGLGYYSRVRNLHSAVKEVVATYDAKVPSDPATISKLKGVGPYTTGAILSIAYDKKVPAVDGNVMRVFSRLFALTDDIAKPATRKKMEQIAQHVIPESAPGDFNQALMELGATICTPQSPRCLFCPVQSVCDAFAQGIEQELPIKTKATPPKQVEVVFAWIEREDHILVEKRPEQGLLAGMWALPTFEATDRENPIQVMEGFYAQKRIPATNYKVRGTLEHIFSHRHWNVTLLEMELAHDDWALPDRWEWMHMREILAKPFSNVYRKAMHFLL